jgi:hypothetical protein
MIVDGEGVAGCCTGGDTGGAAGVACGCGVGGDTGGCGGGSHTVAASNDG